VLVASKAATVGRKTVYESLQKDPAFVEAYQHTPKTKPWTSLRRNASDDDSTTNLT
jgi:hypothetical protein